MSVTYKVDFEPFQLLMCVKLSDFYISLINTILYKVKYESYSVFLVKCKEETFLLINSLYYYGPNH